MKSFVIASMAVLAYGASGCDGCGDNNHHHDVDAADIDAAVDAPTDAFVECNYTEAHDTTNDYLAVDGAIEESGIHFKTGATRTVCGTINNGHFDNVNFFTVDIDNYGITLDTASDVLVRLTGNAQNISQVGVFIVDDDGKFVGGDYFVGNHAVFSAHIAAGHYQMSVEAYADMDATAPVTYEARITTDNPTMRCPNLTQTADYTEAGDGAANNGNDVVAIDYSADPVRTLTGAADSPEPTNLITGAGTNYRITGNSANSALQGSYHDRDTYLITTGPTTNELAIRVKPTNAAADLDYYLFLENNLTVVNGGTTTVGAHEEFNTIAVNPNTRYWLWVGGADPNSGLPTAYDASVCATNFVQ